MNNRLQSYDLLKGIAVLLMIQVHIVELFAVPQFYGSTVGRILLFLGGPPVAPVFLFVFGYFLARSKRSTPQLIKRGLLILLVGLILNISLNFNLIYSVFTGRFNIDIIPYIFGVDILFNAGFSLLIIAVLRHFFRQQVFVFAFLILIMAFLGHYLSEYQSATGPVQYFYSVLYGASWWSYFPLCPWMAYSLSGFVFAVLVQKFDFSFWNKFYVKLLSFLFFVLFMFFTYRFAVLISSELDLYYHHGITFFLWTLAFIALYGFFVHNAETIAGRSWLFSYVRWLGKNVTLVYFIQWVIIGNIATEIYRTVDSRLILLGSFLGILLVTSILAFLFLKTKVLLAKRV